MTDATRSLIADVPCIVRFDETGEEREIVAECDRCGCERYEHRMGMIVVSPKGRAHYGGEYGNTRCGIDATGDKWWWPL